ncbi:MAG: PilZ domain-containing protein [Phycisphaeraceae bacterium]
MPHRNINYFSKAFAKSQEDEHRKGGRFGASGVKTSLGRVVDLSHCGASIIKRRWHAVPDDTFELQVRFAELSVSLQARVVRQTKERGLGTILGLEFVDVADAQREAIKEIIRNSRCWEVFDQSNPGSSEQNVA